LIDAQGPADCAASTIGSHRGHLATRARAVEVQTAVP
jgi:hypothetical protein